MFSGTMMMVSLRSFSGVSPYPSKYPLVYRNRQTAPRTTIYMSTQTQAVPSRTQRIMESISVGGEAGGAYSYNALKRLDKIWSSICSTQAVQQEPQQVVSSFPGVFS
ncbi:uncharacterized protein LOC120153267 [Hibiscus syriacus]|uniref:uncharacterized protein LOC120153267 n=1 Tax=Hibiscus syriacus TaxID=106335 RepID=UPI001921CDFF|nr:uncharacterized protein LOC120153267 [Hibiscus syriacus]